MFGPKIKLDPELHKRAQAKASQMGYSSLEEYIAHLIERDLGEPEHDKAVVDRLKGLGYL